MDYQLFTFILATVVWFIPVIVMYVSDKTKGSEKFTWVFATIFVSWFTWIFYIMFAPFSEEGKYQYELDEESQWFA